MSALGSAAPSRKVQGLRPVRDATHSGTDETGAQREFRKATGRSGRISSF
jgi:hypothetical protein